MLAVFYIHLFFDMEERSRRPHIRLYHTIVPCKCCGDDTWDDCCPNESCACSDPLAPDEVLGPGPRSAVLIASEEPPPSMPPVEEPAPDGLMPPPPPPPNIQGTPNMGVGSSGGVTCKEIWFWWREEDVSLMVDNTDHYNTHLHTDATV